MSHFGGICKNPHIHLPPLRERPEDIPLLAEHFYQQLCCQMNKDIDGFEPGVMEMLQKYHWPGNVRELRNEITKACMIAPHGEAIQISSMLGWRSQA
jgi:DNA-binding NtrC family response regulator